MDTEDRLAVAKGEGWGGVGGRLGGADASNFGKLSSGHRTRKGRFLIPIPKKGNAKECSNYRTTALISHASKAVLKILQARLQQYVNHELPDI